MVYAWGDESVRIHANPPAYLLAATIISQSQSLDPLMKVKPKNARRLHWREMVHSLQSKSLQALSQMAFSTTIVIGSPLPRRKQERGRRKCLELLLVELESRGIDVLVLEARDEEKDKKDIALLLSMRQKGLASTIDIVHMRAEDEPKLWISDQILGAYGDRLCANKGATQWENSWSNVEERIEILNTPL